MAEKNLNEFYRQLEADVTSESNPDAESLADFREGAFTKIIFEDLEQAGVLESPVVCHHEWGSGNLAIKASGYGLPDEDSRLDLIITDYRHSPDSPASINSADIERAFRRVARYLSRAWDGLYEEIEVSDDRRSMADAIHRSRKQTDRVRFLLVTNALVVQRREALHKDKTRGIDASYEIWDIERLRRFRESGSASEPLEIDFTTMPEGGLPCTMLSSEVEEHRTCITIFPGQVLADLYDEHGGRLLELNVRSFLQARGKVNKGIIETIRTRPEDFMSYNNGITVVAEEIRVGKLSGGREGILGLKGLQIVNGGQTTASLHRAHKSFGADLSKVYVQAKITEVQPERFAEVVPLIARYSNSQNKVSETDLSASHPFHVAFERISRREWTPGQTTKWFYERARGSYQTARSREGTTKARLRDFDRRHPASQRITKEELARFELAWRGMPHVVSAGGQKSFVQFMGFIDDGGGALSEDRGLTAEDYRNYIAKGILFRQVRKIVRGCGDITAYRINVTAYVVALLAEATARRIDLDTIWQTQSLSENLANLVEEWAPVVLEKMRAAAAELPYEEAESFKKQPCWERVKAFDWKVPADVECELRGVAVGSNDGAPMSGAGVDGNDLTPQQQNNLVRCRELAPDDWLKIVAWGQASGEIAKWEIGIATTLAAYAAQGRTRISKKQASHGADIIATAKANGIL